ANSVVRTVGLYPELPNANSPWASKASNRINMTAAMYLPEGMPIHRHIRSNCFLALAEYFVGCRSMRTTFLTPRVLDVRYRRAVDRPSPVDAQKGSKIADFSALEPVR